MPFMLDKENIKRIVELVKPSYNIYDLKVIRSNSKDIFTSYQFKLLGITYGGFSKSDLTIEEIAKEIIDILDLTND